MTWKMPAPPKSAQALKQELSKQREAKIELEAAITEPGFWTAYPTEPVTRMQAAIQYPMTDAGFAARVVDAYAVDNRNRLKTDRHG